jgi:hypothetical protein
MRRWISRCRTCSSIGTRPSCCAAAWRWVFWQATSLRVANVSSSEATRLPDSLDIAAGGRSRAIEVGRIEVGDHAHPDGKAVTIAEALAAQLSSDGLLHRLPELARCVSVAWVVAEARWPPRSRLH